MTGKKEVPLVLQPRDELLVSLVSEFRLLSREQLQRLLDFPCVTRINVRLKKLLDAGYLSRRFLPSSNGSLMAFYFIGPRGISLLSEKQNVDFHLLKKERKNLLEQKDLFLNHQLAFNETRIALTLAIKEQPRMALEKWLKEKDCPVEFPCGSGNSGTLRPDAYFCLSYRERFYSFFVEIDCSTMSIHRMKSKAKNYLDYSRSGLFEDNFGLKFFRVLIITKTRERLLNLKSAVEEITDKIFYFTTKDRLCQTPLNRIWYRAGREGLLSLLG